VGSARYLADRLSKPRVIVGCKVTEIFIMALDADDLVCIFPEGSISRSGRLPPFSPGLMKTLHNIDASAVPVYLDGLWGSIFSLDVSKFFWKWPKRWPYPIQIHFCRLLRDRRTFERFGVK